ncbi:Conserved hypothetical protein [gamma proteobacterium HdN1]|nr:Conserved hypothetical protein [gamma proteobacterium HdN1]
MAIAASLQRYFERNGVHVTVHDHAAGLSLLDLVRQFGLSPEQIVLPVVLQSERKALLMALVPMSRLLDLDRVNALLQRKFTRLDEKALTGIFFDAEPGAEPPFGEPYRIPCLVDRSLMEQSRVYFRAGSRQNMASISGEDFQFLITGAPKAVISNERGNLVDSPAPVTDARPLSANAIRASLEKIYRLPPMPPMALKIIETVNDPHASADALAEWVELDPSVAAQIIRYASSPFYGYRAKVTSVREAITRVLGFETVGHIALGIASTKAFKVERDGPLGLRAFWTHALACGVLAQTLARKINQPESLNASQAYLVGLLHNLGTLLVAHLFQPEFAMLNKVARNQPTEPLYRIEQRVIGVGQAQQVIALGHAEVGAILLEQWRLPDPIVIAARHHHEDSYKGEYAPYVELVQLANVLLSHQGIGDLGQHEEPLPLPAHHFPLTNEEILHVAANIVDMYEEISALADRIAA